jgi:predicted aspartyl protease
VSNSKEVQPVLPSTQGDSQQPLDLRIRRDIKEIESVGVSNLITNDQDVVYGSLGPEQDTSAEDFMLVGDDNLRSSQLSRYNLRRDTNLMVQSDVESPLKQLRKRAEIRVNAKNEDSPSKKFRSLSLEEVVEGHSVSTGKHTSAEDQEQMLMTTFQNRMMRSTDRKDRDGDELDTNSEIESRMRSLPRLFESPADQSVHSCQLSETEGELCNKVVEGDVPVNRSMDRIQFWKERMQREEQEAEVRRRAQQAAVEGRRVIPKRHSDLVQTLSERLSTRSPNQQWQLLDVHSFREAQLPQRDLFFGPLTRDWYDVDSEVQIRHNQTDQPIQQVVHTERPQRIEHRSSIFNGHHGVPHDHGTASSNRKTVGEGSPVQKQCEYEDWSRNRVRPQKVPIPMLAPRVLNTAHPENPTAYGLDRLALDRLDQVVSRGEVNIQERSEVGRQMEQNSVVRVRKRDDIAHTERVSGKFGDFRPMFREGLRKAYEVDDGRVNSHASRKDDDYDREKSVKSGFATVKKSQRRGEMHGGRERSSSRDTEEESQRKQVGKSNERNLKSGKESEDRRTGARPRRRVSHGDGDDPSSDGSGDESGSERRRRRRSSPYVRRRRCGRKDSEPSSQDEASERRKKNSAGPKLQMKPEKFDGRSSWETFINQFENCAHYNRWNAKDKAAYLRWSMTGMAAQLLWNTDGCTHAQLVDKFADRFSGKGIEERYRQELRCRRRNKNESIRELAQDVQRLMYLAYPNETGKMTDITAREHFITALDDRELEDKILDRSPDDLESTVRLAQRFELVKTRNAQSKVNRFTGQPPDVGSKGNDRGMWNKNERWVNRFKNDDNSKNRATRDTSEREDGAVLRIRELERERDEALCKMETALKETDRFRHLEQIRNSMNSETRQQVGASKETFVGQPRRNNNCYNCGEPNHFARNCPQPKRNNSRRTEGTGDPDETRSLQVGGMTTKTQRTDGYATYLTARIGRRTLDCLLDTGSEITVFPASLVNSQQIRSTSHILTAANGTAIPLSGEVTLKIKIRDFESTIVGLVSDHIAETMIGIDWLAANRAVWSFGEDRIQFGNHSFELKKKPMKGAVRRV